MKKKNLWLLGLGSITSEKVRTSKFRDIDHFDGFAQVATSASLKFYFFYLAIFVALFVLLARLFTLTVVYGAQNRELSDSNRIKLVEIEAQRGKVFDRNGQILAKSNDVYWLKKGEQQREIDQKQVAELTAEGLAGENFEGTFGQIFAGVEREYTLGLASAHLLGYISIAQEGDLTRNSSIKKNENVGRVGLESSYDDFLRGEAGKNLIEVDAAGRNVSILGSEAPVSGQDLQTSIDLDLQKVVYEVLEKYAKEYGVGKAAAVLSNPQTGEVLSLVSYPAFDPYDIGKYLTKPDSPFFNRAISGNYPPGSVFKIVPALAALEFGKIDANTEIEDVGEFYLGDVRFSNWYFTSYGGRDGAVKVDRAIARSNDIFFYRIAEMVGLDGIREIALKFGFGQKTGIDLPDEGLGLVPDRVWKESTVGAGWYLGDTMHLGIGQGFMLTTPLQINTMTSYMASGKLMKPYIVKNIVGSLGSADIKIEEKLVVANLVTEQNLQLVRRGMYDACQKGGTGWPFFEASYKVGCKTGTAERLEGKPHAWFTVFAPFDNPQISATVLIEEGGEGSSVAGAATKEILDWWMERNK